MIGTALQSADLAVWLVAVAVVITIAGSVVSGHRMHRWLFENSTWIRSNIPPDTGAWIGLVLGVALLLL